MALERFSTGSEAGSFVGPAGSLAAPRLAAAQSTTPAQSLEDSGLEPIISWRAHARGLHSLDGLKAAVLGQRRTWWQGRTFHCPLCDMDFVDATPAAEHVVQLQHPVLRMD